MVSNSDAASFSKSYLSSNDKRHNESDGYRADRDAAAHYSNSNSDADTYRKPTDTAGNPDGVSYSNADAFENAHFDEDRRADRHGYPHVDVAAIALAHSDAFADCEPDFHSDSSADVDPDDDALS
jgi:hypothetical protein